MNLMFGIMENPEKNQPPLLVGIMALCLPLLPGKVPMAEGYGVSEGFVTWQDHEVGFADHQ